MFEHILLPLDGSPLAERVLPHAVALAKAFDSQVTLLQVVTKKRNANQQSIINPMNWKMRKSEAEAYLRTIKARLAKVGIKTHIAVLEGTPALEIINYARVENVQLIILSSHGSSGVSAWNINSVVQKVLLRTFVPVMIIRAYQEVEDDLSGLEYNRVFLPLDGSKRAECILPLAKSISDAHASKVFLTHIVEEPRLPRQTPLSDEDKALISRLEKINKIEAERYLESISCQFVEERVEKVILISSKPTAALHNLVIEEEIDLVILSAHGFSGENRWPYGNIALNFIVFGTTPLLIQQDLSESEAAKSLAEQYAEQSKGH